MDTLRDSNNYKLDDHISGKNNRLKVFGKGLVNVKPDAAEVVIGVTTENIKLEVAQEENANTTQRVINSIKAMGVLSKYIQTQNYNIRPTYDYIDGKQVLRGYEVSNNLKILIRNIDFVGEIIDIGVKNGANTISGVSFIVSDKTKYYYEGLRLAIVDAQKKASVMASELNVNLNIIPIQIIEQDKGDITPITGITFKYESGATPIEAGENKITADIEAIFMYT